MTLVVEVDRDRDRTGAQAACVAGSGVVGGVGVCGVVFELVEAALEADWGEGEAPLWEGGG